MARLVRGRYEPQGVLGRGGQGEVLRAIDHLHGRQVALKVRKVRSDKEREAILQEARILLNLRPHPCVPLVREDFFISDRYYLVMDWVEGANLRQLLEERGGPGLPLEAVLGYLEEVAEALDHLHAHDPPIVHQDVKPANIIVTAEGRAVLVDFGISRRQGRRGKTTMGTPGYLAPELVAGDPPAPSADVFGLAATAFALLTGAPPEPGVHPRWEGVPRRDRDRVERGLRLGLAFDPSRRPASAGDLVAALRPPRVPHNVPAEVSSFVGREREIAEIKELLDTTRLLTLTGAGGCGKTRLALRVASEILEDHRDGVWMVKLAALGDPALVPQAIASAIGLTEEPGRPLTETLGDILRSKETLIVLDNCEHLIDACAKLAEELLQACPHLRLLATSREPLGIQGETARRVPSLSFPHPERPPSLPDLARSEGVRLFVDRARAARPDFRLTEDNAPSVVQLCHRLDGLPLAIELAAARVRALTVEQVVARLDDRFRLLTGGSRTALPRQQTLQATMDWSYELLSGRSKALFRRLSVFAGGFALEAVEAVCGGLGLEDASILDHLARLVDRSLVLLEERGGQARYRLLETVRQYGRDKLLAAGEVATVRDRHFAWCLALAERAEPELEGPEQGTWLDALEANHGNFRAALEWSTAGGGDREAGLRLAGALGGFWLVRGYLSEGLRWLEAALAHGAGAAPDQRAKVLMAAANLTQDLGDYGAARFFGQQGLAVYREVSDRRGMARALNALGNTADMAGDHAAARSLYEEALAIWSELGDKHGLARALNNLGNAAWGLKEFATARSLYEEALALYRDVGDVRGASIALSNLGDLAWERGDHAAARSLYEESLVIRRELGNKRGIAWCLKGLAAVAVNLGRAAEAARLFGAAEAVLESIRALQSPVEQEFFEPAVAALRAALSQDALASAWQEGRDLTADEAIGYALESVPAA
ncbi:MAG: protein kinase domain-containing protein [Actinomycetota bacterium]